MRRKKNNFNFIIANERLPLKDSTFDIAITNHVIEHVNNNQQHIDEIYRVLKKNGIVYLATPNRLWPWEVHYQIPLVHLLPTKLFILFLKMIGKYHEDLHLLFWNQLKSLLNTHFLIIPYSIKLISQPEKYHLKLPSFYKVILKVMPLALINKFHYLSPTFVLILKKYDK